MQRVPDIDDITYEQIFERAVNRIPTMTDQWTDFNFSDPGITVLQTYAWLVDMLNYYMNATGDIHIEKYLKLLGVAPVKRHASSTVLCIDSQSGQIELSRGCEFLAGDIPFYLEEDVDFVPNHFISYLNEADGNVMDLTMFAGEDGDYADLFSNDFTEYAAGWFGFEKKLENRFSVFFTVKDNERRNAFVKDFSFGKLCWEYYTADGFQKLQVIRDETCGLLKSGRIQFEIPDDRMEVYRHQVNDLPAYYIRCVIRDNFYDMLPKIGKIY